MDLTGVNSRGLVLLGCGKMGSALLAGWLARGIAATSVWVVEPNPSDWLQSQGVNLNQGLPPQPAVCVLAVKPQMMGAALPAIAAFGNGDTLFLGADGDRALVRGLAGAGWRRQRHGLG